MQQLKSIIQGKSARMQKLALKVVKSIKKRKSPMMQLNPIILSTMCQHPNYQMRKLSMQILRVDDQQLPFVIHRVRDKHPDVREKALQLVFEGGLQWLKIPLNEFCFLLYQCLLAGTLSEQQKIIVFLFGSSIKKVQSSIVLSTLIDILGKLEANLISKFG